MSENALLELNAPVILVGDVHGQYDDLVDTFSLTGHPSKRQVYQRIFSPILYSHSNFHSLHPFDRQEKEFKSP